MGDEGDSGAIRSYRDLVVWQKAMDLVDAVYELSSRFSAEEKYALTSQLRRAVVSVPSNIAEGYGRQNLCDYMHHLAIANGSLKEVETQIIVAGRQNYITREDSRVAWGLCQEVGKLLNALRKSLS
ncbi:MAG: four helix bundle protein [Phycisphaeraceae bacterium]|nr:four helix bundle protein [Phycisphaeraceae bacterium]